ncbi:MAG TPA: Ku protein [Steroidobacteraceae bacterium]|nr:Ku protein [Steroidobacteraceae bacterium]
MAARSMASLTISFGMVAIPVDLYTTTVSSERISFNLLHEKDGSRVRQQYVCVKEGKVVDRSELTKGYEFAKDQYVMFSAQELKALDAIGSNSIDIVEFVPLASVDPVYFERSYYLAPAKGGDRPYALLAAALRDTERCAVGHWASHGRDHMVILRPRGDALVMHQLLFAAEVRPLEDIGALPSEVREGELKLARQLIEQQATEAFEPTQYVDEVHERIEAAIRKKVEGHEISLSEEPKAKASNVIDLTAALKASLSGRNEPKLGARKPAKRVERRTAARRSSRG